MIATYYPAFVVLALGAFAAGLLCVTTEDWLKH